MLFGLVLSIQIPRPPAIWHRHASPCNLRTARMGLASKRMPLKRGRTEPKTLCCFAFAWAWVPFRQDLDAKEKQAEANTSFLGLTRVPFCQTQITRANGQGKETKKATNDGGGWSSVGSEGSAWSLGRQRIQNLGTLLLGENVWPLVFLFVWPQVDVGYERF